MFSALTQISRCVPHVYSPTPNPAETLGGGSEDLEHTVVLMGCVAVTLTTVGSCDTAVGDIWVG